ncbi:YkgJ family cysteine cluster protein, partial [Candidatus Saccharibacteria bacterium]|nr:YkgJ family cysteine cluster protein [Candidatus Saccharibacteria bacterium]
PPPRESDIPPHTNCKNCGWCCEGDFMVSRAEGARITKYLLDADDETFRYVMDVIATRKRGNLYDPSLNYCPFRDEKLGRCAIYGVRPTVCRVYGVSKNPGLRCPNGNSAMIDEAPYMIEFFSKSMHQENNYHTSTHYIGQSLLKNKGVLEQMRLR